ncbi:MAG: 23S rRNA (adenine(2503)-C(2))-methyltransferase RlmN [Mariprofundaceae bacterium]|nr:23S rRNA (adenine(2503)-C(2))-methyltransferase RlmN [Mariprofundaceae bacterium]
MQQNLPQLPAMTLETLTGLIESWDIPKYRAGQVLQWRNRGILNPAGMLNIPEALKERLSSSLVCEPLQLVQRQCSEDGTRKYLFMLTSGRLKGKMVETVFIPEEKRGTVCVSSQVGCVLDCPFCYTGTQEFEGNLTAGEIVAQILAVKHDLLTEPLPPELHASVTHVVYMGMGEPLANEEGVHESLGILMTADGLKLSRRRITLSTSGLVPQIDRLGEVAPVNLAISLHAAENGLRDELVPINRKYPLQQLRQCLNRYALGKQRHITLEYVMLDGVNDRDKDIELLAGFVNRDRERVNLISFNPYPGNSYKGSSTQRMNEFAKRLIAKGIRATVRRSRGQDIMAACGQLKAASSPHNRES